MTEEITKQFQNLTNQLEALYFIKKNNDVNFQTKKKTTALLFASLKHCNRAVKYKMKAQRTELQTIKSVVDGKRMQLQNIYYEIDHLKNEIAQCNAIESHDSLIPLLTQEEYPDDACEDGSSDHSRHLYRLNCELSLRKKLADAHKELLLSKTALIAKIVEKIEQHSNFMPAVNKVLNSTEALHTALQMSMDTDWKLGSIIQYLPKPLYILLMNINALRKVSTDFIDCDVVGFGSETRQLEGLVDIANKPTVENTPSNGAIDAAQTVILTPHNLYIKLKIGSASRKERLEIYVRYFEHLDCVTALGKFYNDKNEEILTELRSPCHILGSLFDGDCGNNISSVAIDYKLCELGLLQNDCLKYIKEQGYGKPYRWVHQICCISHASSRLPDQPTFKLHKFTRQAISILRKRFLSWVQLGEQLQALAKNEMQLFNTPESFSMPVECNLAEWKSVNPEELDISNLSSELLAVDSSEHCDWFRASIVRSPVKMACFVRITSNYPAHQPLWFISIDWNTNVTHNADIKMIENWTNSLNCKELKLNESLLYAQLIRAMYSFDIFLETESTLSTTPEFEKEKPFIRAFGKRFRMRPYKFCNKGSVLMFKQ